MVSCTHKQKAKFRACATRKTSLSKKHFSLVYGACLTLFFYSYPYLSSLPIHLTRKKFLLYGFSLMWYKKLFFESDALWTSLFNSFYALSSAAVSTVLGTIAAIGINWYKFKGKGYIQTITFLPLVLPEVIVGMSMLIFFSGIKLPLGLFSIFAAHTTFCLPFVFLMVLARLDEFDYSIIEASYDLGATERETMFKVIIPAIFPGIMAGL